jgi:hypothetical protein
MKIFIKYCFYSSILMIVEALLIIFTNDARLEGLEHFTRAISAAWFVRILLVAVLFFGIFNQILLLVAGLVLIVRKKYIGMAVFFIITAVFFFWTVIHYIGDSL